MQKDLSELTFPSLVAVAKKLKAPGAVTTLRLFVSPEEQGLGKFSSLSPIFSLKDGMEIENPGGHLRFQF